MKKQQKRNDSKLVTISQLKQEFLNLEKRLGNRFFIKIGRKFDQINKHFDEIDKQFSKADANFEEIAKQFVHVDQNFATINGKLGAFVSVNSLNIDRAIQNLEERQNKQFNKIFIRIDEFLKRTEENEEEILLLGKQHDNLAKYCTEKIGYPVYGRN